MLIDIHCHLESCKDIKGIAKKIKDSNTLAITSGMNIENNRKALEIAKENENIFASIGLYPHDALQMNDEEIDAELNFIRLNKDKIIAIGEAGLDLLEDGRDTLNRQKEILKKQVLLAKGLDLPIVIHSRKAEAEAIELLEEIGYNKIIMHCFCGKKRLVKRIIENGWFLTVPTNVTRAENFQIIADICPIEQFFCETDSPFLHPFGEHWNEPVNVIESYKKIAEIKGLDLKEVEKKIEENFHKVFKR